MKQHIISFFILIFFNNTYSQFVNVNPVPNGNDLWSSTFVNENTGWIVGSEGFIIKTTDGSTSWSSQNSNVTVTLKSIRFTDLDNGFICGDSGAILKTTDGGTTWLQMFSGTNSNLNSLYFVNGTLGFAAAQNGKVLKTTDAGFSWLQLSVDSAANLKSIFFVSDSIGYVVGLQAKLFKTTDGGLTWIDKSPNYDPSFNKFNSVFFVNQDTGYIGAGNNYNGTGLILYTTDGGNTWEENFNIAPGKRNFKKSNNFTYDDSYGIREIFFLNSLKGFAVVGTGEGWSRTILTTSNGGLNWSINYYGLEEFGLLTICVTDIGNGIAAGFNGSIFKTNDGGNIWNQYFSGGYKYGGEEDISDLFFINDSVGYAVGSRGSFNQKGELILKTTDGGTSWFTLRYYYSYYNQFNSVYFLNENLGWAGADNLLYITTNGGLSWQTSNTNLYDIKSVFFIDSLKGVLATENFVCASNDGGLNWIEKTTLGGNSIFFANQNIGLVVGNNGSIRKTTDGGETWISKFSGTTAELNSVKFFNINLAAACGNNGTFLISTDGGETWISRVTNIPDNLSSLIFKDENKVWCVGSNGIIIESNDLGISWTVHNVTDRKLNTIVIKPDNNIFIAGNKGTMLKYSDNILPSEPHFSKIWSGNPYLPMNIYITSANVENIPLQAGDEIAVFDGDICVGLSILSDSIPSGGFLSLIASMNDPTTSETDGFITNDTITFIVWKSQTQEVIEIVDALYLQGNGKFSPQSTAVVELSGSIITNQIISLTGGWNIVSFNTEPLNKNMLDIFSSLISGETLIKVQDETGNAIEKLLPPIGWINNIGNWSATEGYYTRIQSNVSASLINTGVKISLPLNVPLNSGWNIISYPVRVKQNAMDIVQNLITAGQLIKVQDESGNAIEYLPPPIGWINNIGNFKPGEGYYIKVNQNTLLIYNSPARNTIKAKTKMIAGEKFSNKEQHLNTIWSGNPYLPMNIYIVDPQVLNIITPYDEIGVFYGDYCVGLKQISMNELNQGILQVIASADDPTTIEKDGFITSDPILIKLWDNETNQIINIDLLSFISGSSVFEPLGTSVIRFESIVPVELKSFTASVRNNLVQLVWETASETNNKGFEVERCMSLIDKTKKWEILYFINGNGTNAEGKKYSFTDKNLSTGKYLYRLKQIDFDGLFKYSDEVEVDIQLPDKFSLEQNYPNPFNPSTRIRYSIPVVSNVKSQMSKVVLKVYDILGNEVATLVDGEQAPGSYEVIFETNNLSSGIYIYKLQTDNFVETRKMVLMR